MSTKPQSQQPPANETEEEREAREAAERAGLPGGAPDGLVSAANGDALPEDKAAELEAGALDFMCGDSPPVEFEVDAKVQAKDGLRKVTLHMVQVDGDRLEALTQQHRREDSGPLFGTVDAFSLNCAIIAEACRFMEDPKGAKVTPTDPEFIKDAVAPPYAFERAFKRQPGVAESIAAEVRRMAGNQEDLVGKAKRSTEHAMTAAAGNS